MLNTHVNKKGKNRQGRYFCHMCIVIILVVVMMNLMIPFYLSEKTTVSEKSEIIPETEIILFNCPNCSNYHIYIDIGCFNGETIEHFLHFIPNSTFYNIIIFEPDPQNYKLCQRRLRQKKYANIHITILQKVVWIRDEKVFFHTNRGRSSRIHLNAPGK
jgi:predicted RNA-binding Zn-ribbon protein involved in translation (DUF1610 family)